MVNMSTTYIKKVSTNSDPDALNLKKLQKYFQRNIYILYQNC